MRLRSVTLVEKESSVVDNWKVESGPYPYKEAELIVGLRHLDLVLGRLAPPRAEPERSEQLGLARVVLTNVERTAADVLESLEEGAVARQIARGYPEPALPLDQVLWGLRGWFADRYAGWTPVLGKNRLVGRVHGVGKVSHGGGGSPEEADVTGSALEETRAAGPGHGVRVGVLDTKLFPHPWLAGAWAARFSDTFIDDRHRVPFVPQGHATFVAGLVLSQAPGATVEVRGVLDESGEADSWEVAKEIVRLGRSGVDVLNLSFLCYSEDNAPPLLLATAVDRLDHGVAVVAAAGNHGELSPALRELQADPKAFEKADAADLAAIKMSQLPAWPAALERVIAVGASNADGDRASFSPDAPWVDLHTLGEGVLSTYLPNAKELEAPNKAPLFRGFARWSGTSFAAARVSGAIAAGTDPGHVSSRDALEDILDSLKIGKAPKGLGAHANAPNLILPTF